MFILLCTVKGYFNVTSVLSRCDRNHIACNNLKYSLSGLLQIKKKIANCCIRKKIPKTPTREHLKSDMDPWKSPNYTKMHKLPIFNAFLDAFLAVKAEENI